MQCIVIESNQHSSTYWCDFWRYRKLFKRVLRYSLVLSSCFLCAIGAVAQDSDGVTPHQLNAALGLDLISTSTDAADLSVASDSGSVWTEDAGSVARRLGWPPESKTETQSSYRLYAAKDVLVLGARPYSCALYAEDGKPTQISMVFANKGDLFGKFSGGSNSNNTSNRSESQRQARDQQKELKEETRNFERLLRADATAIEKSLTDALGPATEKGIFGQSRELKERVQRWNWKDTAILLATPRNEYVIVRIMPTSIADVGGRVAKISDADLRQLLLKRVDKRENGDVGIGEIPMVDQGPKGFCVPATWERYLRYLNIPADMYVLAMAGGSELGGGTSVMAMSQSVDDLCRQYGRRIEGINPSVEIRNLSKYIDEGVPIMWSCYIDRDLEISISKRTQQRRSVNDWAAWKKYLDQYRTGAKNIQNNPENGHMRMIIGYNAATNEIAISDSWGPYAAERWMTVEEASAISAGILCVIRW